MWSNIAHKFRLWALFAHIFGLILWANNAHRQIVGKIYPQLWVCYAHHSVGNYQSARKNIQIMTIVKLNHID